MKSLIAASARMPRQQRHDMGLLGSATVGPSFQRPSLVHFSAGSSRLEGHCAAFTDKPRRCELKVLSDDSPLSHRKESRQHFRARRMHFSGAALATNMSLSSPERSSKSFSKIFLNHGTAATGNDGRRRLSSSSVPVPKSDDSPAPAAPAPPPAPFQSIDFATASRIDGEEAQVLTVELRPGEGLRAEAGALVYMTDAIEMSTQLLDGAAARFLTGQSVFLTDYICKDKPGTVCLGTDFYSKILRLSLREHGGSLVCQRGAFLAGNAGIGIEMEFTKSLTAGFFGGQGFILQRLTGDGDVFVKAGGAVVVKDLEEGETLRVTSGSIVAFERSVDYDVQMMPGIKNAMFGGEGLFITTLKGPGRVWLQGMPPDRMIAEIARRVPAGMGFGIPIGLGAGGGGSTDSTAEGGDEAAAAGAESVAATDAAIEADRQATIATSGMMGSEPVDADSPEALFGDAAPTGNATATTDDDSFASHTSESTFSDDSFSVEPQEPSFDDGEFADEFVQDGTEFTDGELFDDSTMSDAVESAAAAEEGGSGIIGTLWDFFMGGDD